MRVIKAFLRRAVFLFLFSVFLSETVSAQRIEWQSCMTSPYKNWFSAESPSPELLCGYLSVPLKYTEVGEDISGENIPFVRLAMTKLPAKSKHKGSLLIISGGPGLPGINPYINFDWPVTNLRESWDIIGFDPRGVGHSIPAINCQQPDEKKPENVTEKQKILQRVNACIHNTGAEVIRHIGTNEAVYDIERIRQALGDKQLTAVAYSYGTQVAGLYAERFPSSIRAIVLDGVVDIDDLNDNFSWQIRQAHSYQETFDRFSSWCARTKSCPLSSDRNQAIHQFHELLLKLHNSPLTDSRGESISSDELISLTTELLLWRSSWSTLATAIRQFSQDIVSNEIETALSSFIASEEVSDALGVILCVDQGDEQLTLEERKSRKIALADAFPAINFKRGADFPDFCELWPIHRDLNKTRRNNIILPSGLLFVAHKYDPTTPWINARKMADRFSAPLLTINGDGHTLALTGTNLCVDEAVVRHLLLPRKTEDIMCQGSGDMN